MIFFFNFAIVSVIPWLLCSPQTGISLPHFNVKTETQQVKRLLCDCSAYELKLTTGHQVFRPSTLHSVSLRLPNFFKHSDGSDLKTPLLGLWEVSH